MTAVQRAHLAGWLLLAMIGFSLAHALLPQIPAWPGGVAGWMAGILLWPLAGRTQRTQALTLLAAGLAAMTWASWSSPVEIQYLRLMTQNLGLLAMLAAVSFLKLVSMPAGRRGPAETGPWAFLRTLLGLHLFGAVINMSIVIIVGDRLARRGRISDNTTRLISRGFASAAFWSPFFAAMATALLYAPDAQMPVLWLFGVPLAGISMLLTFYHARRASPDKLTHFRGYPMQFSALWVPAVLVVGVLLMRELAPQLSVLTMVTLLSPALVLLVLPLRRGPRRALRLTHRHIAEGLPLMRGELTLFLAAGVLAVGLFALQEAIGLSLPFTQFDAPAACLTFGGMLIATYFGVHAVVSIAAVAALAAPLSPDPNLMAMIYLMTWGIGASSSPFGGLTLSLQGRYNIRPTEILRWNLPYALGMYAIGCGLLLAMATWL